MKRIFSLVFAVLWISFCQAQKVKLELNLMKGETYSLNVISNPKVTIIKDGNTVISDGVTYIGMKFKVTDIQDTIYDMIVKFDSMSYNGSLTNLLSTNNFSRPNKPQENKFYNSYMQRVITLLKDKPYFVKMNKLGRIYDVVSVAPDTSNSQKLISRVFQSYLKQIPVIFTGSTVTTGNKWNITTSLETEYFKNSETTYSLNEITNDYLLISGFSNLKSQGKEVDIRSIDPGTKFEGTDSTSSNFKIDRKTGWILDAKISDNLKGTSIWENVNNAGGDSKNINPTNITSFLETTFSGK